jgi:hypothetical protein
MKRASEVPPLVDSSGRRPVTSSIAVATRSVKAPRGVRNATALVGSKESAARPPGSAAAAAPLDLGAQAPRRPEIVEADIEGEADFAGNDVGGAIADVDGDDFEIRGVEIRRSRIERRRLQRGEDRRKRVNGIVGEMGIGDMALAAGERQPAGERAATAVLDRVAERGGACRLADEAMIETFAARERPF